MPSTNGTKRAILYARVSTRRQAEEDHYSIPQQLAALREYASREGYEVPEGYEIIDPGYSGASLERPGMDRVRDLVAAGGVSVVLAQDRDRFAREPAYLYILKEEFARSGCSLRALNSRGDDSPEGELTDGLLDQIAKYTRAKVMDSTRKGKRQKARQGGILPSRQPPMGFTYADGAYTVNEPRIVHVRRMFQMVGACGATLGAVKAAFEADGVPTQRNAEYWNPNTIRRMIDNPVYLALPYQEVAALVGPEVAAQLDPTKSYSIYWYNRQRHTKDYTGPKRNIRTDNDPSEWIAAPVADPGIPPEWVKRARAAVKDNVRPPDTGKRFWELKSLLFCPCGHRMTTFVSRRNHNSKSYFTYHYVCSHQRRHGKGACEHARYHTAHEIEERIRQLILDLVRRPEVMMQHVREDIERERARLKHTERERAGWIEELGRIERKRDTFIEMRSEGDLSKEKYRQKVVELDARRAVAERELAALQDSAERMESLESLPGLIEEYTKDLPDLLHRQQSPIRAYVMKEEVKEELHKEPRKPYVPKPEMYRKRTLEEKEELSRARELERSKRYRGMYELLDLKIVGHKDGTLDISGSFGIRQITRSDGPGPAWQAVTGTVTEGEIPCPQTRSSRPARYRGSPGVRAGS